MGERRRRKMFVDSSVQGALVARVTMYWVHFLVAVAFLTTCWVVYTGNARNSGELAARVWQYCGPPLIASLLLLPLVILDCIRITNRFVGPLIRLRRGMRELAEGQEPQPILFRKHDYWQDLATDFNNVCREVQTIRESHVDSVTDQESSEEIAGIR
jgi:methyl-accepting chemotaxis protein